MKRRSKILIALLLVLPALIGIGLAILRLGPQSDVDAYKKSLLAHGEKLDIADVTPAPAPPEQNGADVFNDANRLITREGVETSNNVSGMRLVAPGKAMVCFAQPDVRDSTFTASWANITMAVEDNRAATELLAQAAHFPRFDFHIDYSAGPELPLEYLVGLRKAVRLLSTAAICHLHNGDAASTTTNICAMVGLVNAEQDDPFLISQMVRIVMVEMAVGPTWELLQATNIDDVQLALLQKSWGRLEYVHPLEISFLMERAHAEMTIKKMLASDDYFNHVMHLYAPARVGRIGPGPTTDDLRFAWENMKFDYAQSMWRASWRYSDELRMLQEDQVALETIRAIETNGGFNPVYDTMKTRLASLGMTNDPDNPFDISNIRWLFSGIGPALSSTMNRTLTAVVTRNIVVTAIALKRCHLKYGRYPATLSQLVPEFLAAVPRDPVDGNSLRYHPNTDGTYLLYSIGANGKDDGGNPLLDIRTATPTFSWLNAHALDWVWPQPATPAEIQSFYNHPPK